MHEEAIKERTDSGAASTAWSPRREIAPSTIVAVQPTGPRIVGAIGLVFLVLGGFTLGLYTLKPGSQWLVPYGLAWILAVLGIGGVLYHALTDGDIQVRRLYHVLGYALFLAAVFLTWVPRQDIFGAFFVPWGVLGFVLGLVLMLAFLRHETEPQLRDIAIYTIGIVGGVLALLGFLFSSFDWATKVAKFLAPNAQQFLLHHGVLFILLGLVFGTVFIALRPRDDKHGFWSGVGMGIGGGLFFLIACYRSYIAHLFVTWKWLISAASYIMPDGVVKWLSSPAYYTMPDGLLLMGLGLLYAFTAIALISELPLVVMIRREFTRYFCTPIAYIVLLACIGLSFGVFLVFQAELTRVALGGQAMREPIVGDYLFGLIPVVTMVAIVPLLTMGSLSEEQRTGTMEMLLTVRLTETSIVISKFVAALGLFMVFWLPWAGYLISLRVFDGQSFDYRPLLSFYIAIVCLGVNFIAMGLFFSSLTQNQLTAGVLSFVAMMLLIAFIIFFGSETGKFWGDVMEHTSFIHLWRDAVDGKLALRRLIYHLSAGVFWLVLTVKILEVRRWR